MQITKYIHACVRLELEPVDEPAELLPGLTAAGLAVAVAGTLVVLLHLGRLARQVPGNGESGLS